MYTPHIQLDEEEKIKLNENRKMIKKIDVCLFRHSQKKKKIQDVSTKIPIYNKISKLRSKKKEKKKENTI